MQDMQLEFIGFNELQNWSESKLRIQKLSRFDRTKEKKLLLRASLLKKRELIKSEAILNLLLVSYW